MGRSGLPRKRIGASSATAFGFGILMMFLILAALYERWSLPIAVVLAVLYAFLGAMTAIWLRGTPNDIYFQIGLLVLIGLTAKNAILIVEFAAQKMEEGMGPFDAALEAAGLRFRPILMTSFAFVLGVVPLIIATGAGAGPATPWVRASSAECSPPPSSRPSSCRCSSPGSRGSRRRSADQERLRKSAAPYGAADFSLRFCSGSTEHQPSSILSETPSPAFSKNCRRSTAVSFAFSSPPDVKDRTAVVHHDEAVAVAESVTHVVRDHERRELLFGHELSVSSSTLAAVFGSSAAVCSSSSRSLGRTSVAISSVSA